MDNNSFPKPVEYRGNKAVIYRQSQRGYQRFEVRYYDVDGRQQRFTFTTCEAAKEFAKATVREIAQNRSNFITLRGQEAYDYQSAAGLLATTGLGMRDAASLITEGIDPSGGPRWPSRSDRSDLSPGHPPTDQAQPGQAGIRQGRFPGQFRDIGPREPLFRRQTRVPDDPVRPEIHHLHCQPVHPRPQRPRHLHPTGMDWIMPPVSRPNTP